MPRDSWVEVLKCPHCGKTGKAQLSAEDAYSSEFRVDHLPEGFQLVEQSGTGSAFCCVSCNKPTEP